MGACSKQVSPMSLGRDPDKSASNSKPRLGSDEGVAMSAQLSDVRPNILTWGKVGVF